MQNPEYTENGMIEIVRGIVADEMGLDLHHVGADATLIDDLGVSEFDMISILMTVDANLGILLMEEDEAYHRYKTPRELAGALLAQA